MIGFDIGGTKCAVCIGEEHGETLEITGKKMFMTSHEISPYETIDKMYELAKSMTDDLDTVGISCGGPLDSKRGIIQSPPNLPGWDNVRITDYLKEKYGCDAYLQNDANACAVAEWKYGAGRGTENMIFLTFGTGMGAGLILNGKLYSGTNDMAGEIGHVRMSDFGPIGYGKAGSFEGFCSGGGIAQIGKTIAAEKLQMGETVSYCTCYDDMEKITAKSIAEYAKKGNADAISVYDICAKKLGFGLSILIDILNPEVIVIGSIYQRSKELLEKKTLEVIKKETLKSSRNVCSIRPSFLGDSLGDYAAVAVAAASIENR